MSRRPRRSHILVLYYYRGPVPPRASIDAHLFCWQRFSENDVVMVNLALGYPERLLRRWGVDVVIFHTLFFSMRWGLPTWERALRAIESLKTSTALKIAMPQDEFYRTDLVDEFLIDFAVDELWTCAKPKDQPKIYPRASAKGVLMKQVLTGYIDTEQRARIEKIVSRSTGPRDIDVGYRAWKAEPWLGRHGMLKLWIGQKAQTLAVQMGLGPDISLEEKDVITGDDWFHYLARCKTVVGCEGGSGICDRDGTLRMALQEYRTSHPHAEFEEIYDRLLRERDGEIELWALSPRHFEACMTGTVQILVEGDYNGALKAGDHYIPVLRDLSNLNEALAKIRQPEYLSEIARRARDEVAMSDRWTYQRFVGDLDRTLPIVSPSKVAIGSPTCGKILQFRDRVCWFFVAWENRILQQNEAPFLKTALQAIKNVLKIVRR